LRLLRPDPDPDLPSQGPARRSGARARVIPSAAAVAFVALSTAAVAVFPRNVAFFKYDWTRTGLWNLVFAGGIVVGGFIGGVLLASPEPVAVTARAHADLAGLGVHDFAGLVPH